jgi:hypothetical protein
MNENEDMTEEIVHSEEDGTRKIYRRLLSFHDPKDLFHFYEMFEDCSPVSWDWFREVWKETFPQLIVSTERPCELCDDLNAKILKFTKAGDYSSANSARTSLEEHASM